MKHKLLALAVLGVFATPFGVAQAQGSNVSIYGQLTPSLDFIDNGDERGSFVQGNNSRIGFKGSEDLGGGLKAIFQIESQLDFDERGGDNNFWGRRDSWVGLAGAFGSLTVGNHQSAYVRSSAYLDPLSDSIGDYNNIMSVVSSSAAGSIADDDFNSRFKNSFYYTSPKFGGFELLASYALRSEGFDDDTGPGVDHGDDNTYSAAVTWKGGPVAAVLAYEKQKNDALVSGTNAEPSAWKLGASFKILPTTTLYAMVDRIDTDTTRDERWGWYVAGKHSMGKIDLLANFMWAGDTDGDAAAGIGDDDGAKAWTVGAAYNFSKRTSLMALYSQVNNDDDGFYGMDSGGYAPASAGENVKGVSVKMIHKF